MAVKGPLLLIHVAEIQCVEPRIVGLWLHTTQSTLTLGSAVAQW